METNRNLTFLMEVSGLEKKSALKLLEETNDNLDMALNTVLEGYTQDDGSSAGPSSGSSSTNKNSNSSSSSTSTTKKLWENAATVIEDDDEDNIRAPIPPKREILVYPEDDNFRIGAAASRKRRNARQVVYPLRNFAREGELLEEMLMKGTIPGSGSSSSNSSSVPGSSGTSNRHGGSGNGHSQTSKYRKLEDLFRPPIDLIYHDSFIECKEYATRKDKWLLVNIQDNNEFKCQILNRDLWSTYDLKYFIQRYFIFWQKSIDYSDGLKFKSFYKINQLPHIAILDPRTGEEKISYSNTGETTTPEEFLKTLKAFLIENKSPEGIQIFSDPEPTASITIDDDSNKVEYIDDEEFNVISSDDEAQVIDDDDDCSNLSVNIVKPPKTATPTKPSAIKNKDNNKDKPKSSTITLDEFDVQGQLDREIEEMQKSPAPKTRLMLKLPENKSEIIEWSSESKINTLIQYLIRRFSTTIPLITCKFFCPAIKRNLVDMEGDSSLVTSKIHPSAVLHLYPDE